MTALELLAPARNMEIGIAAIDCGADAVYIAGPDFGARKAAGNDIRDIAGLCEYAHRFGVRIFVTFNTIVDDSEIDRARLQMCAAQEAGADAFIIRDPRITTWKEIRVPLHASTQCAIRDVRRAEYFESIGCSRIILERELSLETIKEICSSVDCEVEFFVHGALCVCYSGDCRLSEQIDGRSADRGECIQACRSLYDLTDSEGRILARNKALLSLKDYNLKNRLKDLAEAGVSSFKIEGRLKNTSYVKNVVRDYSLALDELVRTNPDKYCRASKGHVSGGFTPDTLKTFNRGYTELWLDSKRDLWSSMNAPKSMGEAIGTATRIRRAEARKMTFRIKPFRQGLALRNGDGLAFATGDGVTGFRADVCNALEISCKDAPDLREGMTVYRNIDTAFEKELETNPCKREISVSLHVTVRGKFDIEISARSEDGREITSTFNADLEAARNKERSEAMLREQLSKRSGHYNFLVESIIVSPENGPLPLLSASTINSMRRLIAQDLDALPCRTEALYHAPLRKDTPQVSAARNTGREGELMRTRYCIKYELGLCPVHQGAKPAGPLFLVNNGRRLALGFDCKACEMTVSEG